MKSANQIFSSGVNLKFPRASRSVRVGAGGGRLDLSPKLVGARLYVPRRSRSSSCCGMETWVLICREGKDGFSSDGLLFGCCHIPASETLEPGWRRVKDLARASSSKDCERGLAQTTACVRVCPFPYELWTFVQGRSLPTYRRSRPQSVKMVRS